MFAILGGKTVACHMELTNRLLYANQLTAEERKNTPPDQFPQALDITENKKAVRMGISRQLIAVNNLVGGFEYSKAMK